MSRARILAAVSLVALVSACTHQQTRVMDVAAIDGPRADVNPGYKAGQLAMPNVKTPSLQEMMDLQPTTKPLEGATEEDRLRAPAIRDAALSYGARGGLAWASKQINDMLRGRAAELSRTYDFTSLLIKGPNGTTVLPPVISESRNTYEQTDAGKSLRIADTYYEIIEQARFAPVAPLWHTYLVRSYTTPTPPMESLLPKNDGERDLWKKFVAEGWEQGVRQAQDIFQVDIRRLERDFTGMVRYAELLEKGQVSAPVIADTSLGVTGTGQDMRVNDRAMRITADPRLNVHRSADWTAPVWSGSPTDAATPPGAVPGVRNR